MSASKDGSVKVRRLRPDDLERTIAIDQAHTGRPRRRFFQKRLDTARSHPEDFIHVGVTRDGVLVGEKLGARRDGSGQLARGHAGVADRERALARVHLDRDLSRRKTILRLLLPRERRADTAVAGRARKRATHSSSAPGNSDAATTWLTSP